MEPIHPLSLPEIVLLIGKAIPLWIPEDPLFGETAWMLRPKDLVAAISVNRLFRSVLTPLLWTVYYEPNENMRVLANIRGYQEYRGLYTQIDIDTVEENSVFFRYLDVSANIPISGQRRAGMLQLECQHLQELRVSSSVGFEWVSRLIKLNPNLQVLDWPRKPNHRTVNMLELKSLFSLRRLRRLGLQGWNLQSLFLCHILKNNADCLEEINLGTDARFIDEPRMNDDWSGLRDSSVAKMTKSQVDKATKLIRGQRLLLPKVRTFHMNCNPYEINNHIHSLVRALPALETLVVEGVDKDTVGLSQRLREYCPRLRAIKHSGLYRESRGFRFSDAGGTMMLVDAEGTMMMVDACIPGKLTHLSLDLAQIDTSIKETILKQSGGGLEVLELFLHGGGTMNATLANLHEILEQSKRLKRVWMRNADASIAHTFESVISVLLQDLRCCQELESLTMLRFFGAEEEEGLAIDRENDEREESEDQRQQRTTTGTTGDDKAVSMSSFTLPPGWLETKGSHWGSYFRTVPLSSTFLKRKVFEAVGDLPKLREIELNVALFHKKIVSV